MGISPWPLGQIEAMGLMLVRDGGAAINLTGLTASNIAIIFQPSNANGGYDVTGTGTVTILNATQGYIQYLPSAADVGTAANYYLRAQVTFPGTGTITSDGITFNITPV